MLQHQAVLLQANIGLTTIAMRASPSTYSYFICIFKWILYI